MSKKNELALDLQTSTELAPVDLYQDFSDFGHENIGFADVKFPEIILIQDNSKYYLKKYKEFGLKPGDFLNTVEGSFSNPINVIPFHVSKYFDVRVPKGSSDASSLKLLQLPETASKVPESNYYLDPALGYEHRIFETYCYLVLLENMTFAKIIFQKSRHKMAMKFNTLIKSRGNKPAFRFKYRLHSFEDSYNGNSWFNIDMTCLEELDPKSYNQVGELARQIAPHISSIIMAEEPPILE